jgi:hypothetical protein
VGYVIAVAIGLAIFGIGLRLIQILATPPPPEPDPDEVVDVAIDFRCVVCGLQLTVTQAQDEPLRPPRHCREPMEPLEV